MSQYSTPVSANQIATDLGLEPRTLQRHLKAAVEAGVLVRTGAARAVKYALPTPAGVTVTASRDSNNGVLASQTGCQGSELQAAAIDPRLMKPEPNPLEPSRLEERERLRVLPGLQSNALPCQPTRKDTDFIEAQREVQIEYEADILARGEAAQLAAHEEAQREMHAAYVAAQLAHEEGERMVQEEAEREMFAAYVERERARSEAAQYAAHEAEQAEQFEFFEERAAFFEFDAGFMRAAANAAAGRLFEPGVPGGYWLPLPERPQPERTRIELASTEREQRKLETTWSPTGPAG